MKQVEKTTGKKRPELTLPELPAELEYLVQWASSLHGAESLSYSEIKAWADLMQTYPAPWEVEALVKLDNIFQAVRHE